MNKFFPDWVQILYDFIFVLVICVFGYGVQIGFMFLKEKLLKRNKIIVLFFVNLSISFVINFLMKKMGWGEWSWLGIWFYNSQSIWLSDVIGARIKTTFEMAVPAIILSWVEKLKAKNTTNNNDPAK